MLQGIFDNWWRNPKLIGRGNAIGNIATGIGCIVCLFAGWGLGLGSVAPYYLGYFAVVSLPWGLLALRYGTSPSTARPLRLTGDVLAWIAFIGFAIVGIVAFDPPEYEAFWTLVIVASFTIGTFILTRWLEGFVARRGPSKQAVSAPGQEPGETA